MKAARTRPRDLAEHQTDLWIAACLTIPYAHASAPQDEATAARIADLIEPFVKEKAT